MSLIDSIGAKHLKELIPHIYRYFAPPGRPVRWKALVLAVVAAAVAGLAAMWLGLAGPAPQRAVAGRVYRMTGLTPPSFPLPSPSMTATIASTNKVTRPGLPGNSCNSGETVYFDLEISEPGYTMLVNWNGKEVTGANPIHVILPASDTARFSPKGNIAKGLEVVIDGNTGTEIFYAFSSFIPISVEADIKPLLNQHAHAGDAMLVKGAAAVRTLQTPDHINLFEWHCRHVK